MAFQREVGAGTNRATTVLDLLTKIVAFATSRNVATVAINAAGNGYVVGEEITLTHAGAILDAKFVVTAISGGPPGPVTALRITSNGAFADRVTGPSIGAAAGTGYNVGDVVQVQGGSAREEAKVRVDAAPGGVPSAVSLYETGGAYSTPPALTNAVTVGVGPSTYAGDDGLQINSSMTGIVGTTALATTASASGTGLTVDITLAETGWDSSERNTNDYLINGFDLHKQVTLKGDAAGKTNKPFSHWQTRKDESGIKDRYNIQIRGSISHNPAQDIASQVGLSTWAFLSCDEDEAQQMDFWITANDQRIGGFLNINPAAGTTDDGEYMHFYVGYYNSLATETEDPYPFYVFASTRTPNVDPSVASQHITGLSEQVAPTGQFPGSYFFRSEDSTWVPVVNSQNLSTTGVQNTIMFPVGRVPLITLPASDNIAADGPISFWTGMGSMGRTVPTRRFVPVPGATPKFFPIPLSIVHRAGGTTTDQAKDTVRGQLDGFFWISATDGAVATIANFSEDYITIGSDRYRVFHTHAHNELYHYVCVKEDN